MAASQGKLIQLETEYSFEKHSRTDLKFKLGSDVGADFSEERSSQSVQKNNSPL